MSFNEIFIYLQILNLWLKNKCSVSVIDLTKEYGGILHYFAAHNYAAGIKKLTREPHNLPPDKLNQEGYSPLLIAVKDQSLDAMVALLRLDVDIMLEPMQNKGNFFRTLNPNRCA